MDGEIEVYLFIDGVCCGNFGFGGWVFVFCYFFIGKEFELFGGE